MIKTVEEWSGLVKYSQDWLGMIRTGQNDQDWSYLSTHVLACVSYLDSLTDCLTQSPPIIMDQNNCLSLGELNRLQIDLDTLSKFYQVQQKSFQHQL